MKLLKVNHSANRQSDDRCLDQIARWGRGGAQYWRGEAPQSVGNKQLLFIASAGNAGHYCDILNLVLGFIVPCCIRKDRGDRHRRAQLS